MEGLVDVTDMCRHRETRGKEEGDHHHHHHPHVTRAPTPPSSPGVHRGDAKEGDGGHRGAANERSSLPRTFSNVNAPHADREWGVPDSARRAAFSSLSGEEEGEEEEGDGFTTTQEEEEEHLQDTFHEHMYNVMMAASVMAEQMRHRHRVRAAFYARHHWRLWWLAAVFHALTTGDVGLLLAFQQDASSATGVGMIMFSILAFLVPFVLNNAKLDDLSEAHAIASSAYDQIAYDIHGRITQGLISLEHMRAVHMRLTKLAEHTPPLPTEEEWEIRSQFARVMTWGGERNRGAPQGGGGSTARPSDDDHMEDGTDDFTTLDRVAERRNTMRKFAQSSQEWFRKKMMTTTSRPQASPPRATAANVDAQKSGDARALGRRHEASFHSVVDGEDVYPEDTEGGRVQRRISILPRAADIRT
jgi:hypothetical protein